VSPFGAHLRAEKVNDADDGTFVLQIMQIFSLFLFPDARRQEYLGMQAKYSALEGRSKDLLLSQGSAVSGANVALASLQSRIEHLVEQLISSYNISEQDLEVS
jgi:hypothetical protein